MSRYLIAQEMLHFWEESMPASLDIPSVTIPGFLDYLETSNLENDPQALAWGISLLRHSTFQERWRLAKVFPQLGKQAIAPLLALAEDPQIEIELRWFAIRILGNYQNPKAIARLLLLLGKCPEEFLQDAIVATIVQLEASAVDYLLPLLTIAPTRTIAIETLCKLRYPEIIDPLLGATQEEEPRLRCLVIETLSQFRQPRILAALFAALDDPAAQVRRQAVKSLGYWSKSVPSTVLCEKLTPLLKDFDLGVCEQAALALSRLALPDAAQAIAMVLNATHTPLPLQLSLISALGWLPVPESLWALEAVLYKSAQPLVLETVKILGRLTDPSRKIQAATILIQFWQSQAKQPSGALLQEIIYTFGQLGDPRAKSLLKMLTQDTKQVIQLHAAAALKKLAELPHQHP